MHKILKTGTGLPAAAERMISRHPQQNYQPPPALLNLSVTIEIAEGKDGVLQEDSSSTNLWNGCSSLGNEMYGST